MRVNYSSDGTLITIYFTEAKESLDFTEAVCAYMRVCHDPESNDPRDRIMRRLYKELAYNPDEPDEDIELTPSEHTARSVPKGLRLPDEAFSPDLPNMRMMAMADDLRRAGGIVDMAEAGASQTELLDAIESELQTLGAKGAARSEGEGANAQEIGQGGVAVGGQLLNDKDGNS